MPEFTPAQRKSMQYWSVIESATFNRQNVSDLWQRIRDQAEALGYGTPGLGARDVNWLRSLAVGNRNAREALGDLGPENFVGPEHIGMAPYARDLAERVALPRYSIRFEHTVIRDGEEVTEWRTSIYTSTMPRSKRELELALAQDAAMLADSYNVENVGVGDYLITEI